MQKIIKEKVKEQVKVQVSKILPKIEQTVNEQLEAEVLTWSSNSSKTSYAIAADLFEMELKKTLIEKMTSASESATSEETMQTTFEMEELAHLEFETGTSSRKYTTCVTKTKAADYGHIKWIKDLVPRTMWIQEPIGYDKHALWGVSHWGHKRQQFYDFAVNRESACDVYSKHRIITVTELKIVEWHNYKHLDWITMRRDDDKLYKFKEGDFKRLRIQDIKDIDGTLTDVRTALDDRLKGIRIKYLPQSIWKKSDKDRATAMIQAIDKRLKTRRIMRSLERFVGGRLYERDYRML
nr:hypothetical protein [Tanacetum cinerariifolium]